MVVDAVVAMAFPVTMHEVHLGVKQDKSFIRMRKMEKISGNRMNTMLQSLKWIILTVFFMTMIFPRMLEKKLFGAVWQKMQFL
jgi:hypothetical protein